VPALPAPVFGGFRPLPAAPPVLVAVATAGGVTGTEVLVTLGVGVLVKLAAVFVALAAAVSVATTTAVSVALVSAVAVVFAVDVFSASVGVFVAVGVFVGVAVLVGVGVGVSTPALTEVVPPPITAPSTIIPARTVAAPTINNPVRTRSAEPGRVVFFCKVVSSDSHTLPAQILRRLSVTILPRYFYTLRTLVRRNSSTFRTPRCFT
jgi:hypothetical protein